MIKFNGTARTASLLVLGLFATGASSIVYPALAAPLRFIGGADDTNNSWENTDNWSTNTVPGQNDDVVVKPSNQGAQIQDGDNEKVNSLILRGGLNVANGGKLTVTDSITNRGVNSAYFINDGVVAVQDGATVGTVTNSYVGDDHFGYIANTRKFTANLDNSGAVINGGADVDGSDVIWIGNVTNTNTGFIDNIGGTWRGDVEKNRGQLINEGGSTWIGDIQSNRADIENLGGSVWKGDVLANKGVVSNIEGGVWEGDVVTNDNSVNNDGGTWKGDVLSNTGTIFNTATSVWKGDITSSGELWFSGTVKGAITNNGGTLHVYDPLAGVTSFVNNGGGLDMDDSQAGSTFKAQSWSGSGSAFMDFAPGLGVSDHVVLSGDYSADTDINLAVVGPAGRTLGDIPLILVGGADTGNVNVSGLPDDGIISYRLAHTGANWVIASALNDAPSHAADMVLRVGDAVSSATQLPVGSVDTCGRGAWARPLGGARTANISGAGSSVDFAGVQFGYDLPCVDIAGSGAKLGFGVTAGSAFGSVVDTFNGSDQLTGTFGQGFAGAYADLVAGPLHAIVQSQVGVTGSSFSDQQSALDTANLTTTRYDLSGSASYDLAVGSLTVAPELGFAASGSGSGSDNFGDVGRMGLTASPTVDLHAGATVSGNIALFGGTTTLSPFASVSYHQGFIAPDSAVFTDGVGGAADVPVNTLGNYVAVGVGADLLRISTGFGNGIDGGLRADLKLGAGGTDAGFDGHLRLQF